MKKLTVFFLFCSVLFCGCVPSRQIENNLTQIRIAKGNEMLNDKTDEERAQDIKEILLMKMSEVKGAAVVVESHTALIGLRLDEQYQEDSIELKEKAGQLAKESDDTILGASVTTNDKIISMIEDLERKRQKISDKD